MSVCCRSLPLLEALPLPLVLLSTLIRAPCLYILSLSQLFSRMYKSSLCITLFINLSHVLVVPSHNHVPLCCFDVLCQCLSPSPITSLTCDTPSLFFLSPDPTDGHNAHLGTFSPCVAFRHYLSQFLAHTPTDYFLWRAHFHLVTHFMYLRLYNQNVIFCFF